MTTTMPSSHRKVKHPVIVERISRADDPRIAPFRAVRDPELVRRRGQFIAEGRLVVRRALEDDRFRVRAVLVNDAALAQLEPVLAAAGEDTLVCLCDAAVFAELTGYRVHRGCLALVDRPPARTLDDAIAASDTVVVLEQVANADNVGAVFRHAAAFGCGAVVLSSGSCDPLYRKAIRTSMGAVLRVPFAIAASWTDALARIREAGFVLAALTPREPAVALDAFARTRPPRVALVAGAEGAGLGTETESVAEVRVRIPINDDVDSLNVAMAVAIALYELQKPV